jgi:hypothetical protein
VVLCSRQLMKSVVVMQTKCTRKRNSTKLAHVLALVLAPKRFFKFLSKADATSFALRQWCSAGAATVTHAD